MKIWMHHQLKPVAQALLIVGLGLCSCASQPSSAESTSGGQTAEDAKSIACGSVSCTEVCCATKGTCASAISDCLDPESGNGSFMTCDGYEDCEPSHNCCISVNESGYGSAQCVDDIVFCRGPNTEFACHDDGHCPPPLKCSLSSFVDAFVPGLTACE